MVVKTIIIQWSLILNCSARSGKEHSAPDAASNRFSFPLGREAPGFLSNSVPLNQSLQGFGAACQWHCIPLSSLHVTGGNNRKEMQKGLGMRRDINNSALLCADKSRRRYCEGCWRGEGRRRGGNKRHKNELIQDRSSYAITLGRKVVVGNNKCNSRSSFYNF